eukprot:snap_masked-scaffold_1-processed-gene-17.13-mRNA-1 protein AED:1.00 eAED:1.00 QI:0/-1/0/0/-1/1/1/0/204
MKSLLQQEGVWGRINSETTPSPDGPASAIRNSTTAVEEAKAKHLIYIHLQGNILERISTIQTSAGIWKKLEDIFSMDIEEEKEKLKRSLQQPQGKSHEERVNSYDASLQRYKHIGGSISDKEEVEGLLNILKHKRIYILKLAREIKLEKYTYDDLFKNILSIADDLDNSFFILCPKATTDQKKDIKREPSAVIKNVLTAESMVT